MRREATVLVLGGGGREHAIAWKLAASPRVARIVVAPGNGGIDRLAATVGDDVLVARAPDPPRSVDGLAAWASELGADLTIVGPEAPLADGVVDAFEARGLRCFGPTADAARIESSKTFAKAFMSRHGIPTAAYEVFTSVDAAVAWVREADRPLVVKASGLAAGKGVFVCGDAEAAERALVAIMREGRFGDAGREVVIEERLVGEELSVMAFTDGEVLVPMPAVQDHKAAYEGDRGPNTGGMGAYTPVPAATPEVLADIAARILRPAVAGLRAEGRPFVGVLYAGVMLTSDGPRVLEFNGRFGDPETQVVLPLLEGDLYELALACVEGRLDEVPVAWERRAAATVVAASGGYPGAYTAGKVVSGFDAAERRALIFHAGTRYEGEALVTSGGRVLAVTGVADKLSLALAAAYDGLSQIDFDGMHVRRDIGHRALAPRSGRRLAVGTTPGVMRYRDAGVDIDAGAEAVSRMAEAVRSTYTPHVLSGVGAFGGLFDGAALAGVPDPVLVASTDGVGTKSLVATHLGWVEGLGRDLVNHCIDDILVQGARPLFFLDYVASSRLDPAQVAEVVGGMAAACRESGCVLLGGETAEMPGVYREDALDVAGTIVGVVSRGRIIDGRGVAPGHKVLGLPSSGLHTNGYSLARRIVGDPRRYELTLPGEERTVGEALLAPHRSYLPEVEALWAADIQPRGLVHITGGGLVDNPPRVIPEGLALRLWWGSWKVPAIFRWLMAEGGVPIDEMRRVFNMGLGMLVVIAPEEVSGALAVMPGAVTVGEIVERAGGDPAVIF